MIVQVYAKEWVVIFISDSFQYGLLDNKKIGDIRLLEVSHSIYIQGHRSEH